MPWVFIAGAAVGGVGALYVSDGVDKIRDIAVIGVIGFGAYLVAKRAGYL